NTTAPGQPLSFAPPASFPTDILNTTWGTVHVADFNNDGKPDLVVGNAGSNTVWVLLNTTAPGATVPSFTPQTTFAVVAGKPYAVAVGDFNNDGKPDIAVAVTSDHSLSSVTVFLNTTDSHATTPSFAPAMILHTDSDNPNYIAVGDFNSDG